MQRFHRSNRDRMIAGVCGGLGEYFNVDPNLVRFAFVAIAVFSMIAPTVLVYLAAWLIFPPEN